MIKEIKKITKQNLDLKNLEENQLSIQLSLDGFSFCIYNSNYKIINAFAHFEFENVNTPYKHLELVENLFKQEPLLQAKFKNVNVTHFNNLVTQVPLPFFNKDNLGDYLKYSVKVLENDYLVYDQISNSEIVNVYIPFVNINNFLIDKFGAFNYKHSSTVLIETLLNKYKNFEKEIMFVNVTNLNFEIVVLKKNKLELYNSFSFKTKEDFIYYILFVAEQLNLNPEEFQLLLLGDIEKESELYAIAFQYVRNIDFYKEHSTIKIIENVSPHSYFTLLNQF
ncbi:DUF3822 family protein [uncultured Lutibacter sp.]|uniref:DUF3822 family protein n=1 Tax=uncultured Lutibacter sp. TaxID=437739 RepID=UPI002636A462|nr:DUF3822 family protein [uncultured Lutibacter sp.]